MFLLLRNGNVASAAGVNRFVGGGTREDAKGVLHRPKRAAKGVAPRPNRGAGGAVAQMGERCNRTAEVRGSIPLSSTSPPLLSIRSC